MSEREARSLAADINGGWIDWEATVEDGVFGWDVVAVFEEGGCHRLHSRADWDDVRALVYGEDEDDEESEGKL